MQKNQALQFDLISTQIRTGGAFSKEFAMPLQGTNHHDSRPHKPGDEALDTQRSFVRDDAPDGASLSQLLDKQHIPVLKMRVADKAMPISCLAETGRLREADREVIDHAIGFNQNVCAVCSMASFSDSHQNVACGLRNAIRHAHYSYGAWDRRSAIESIFEAWRISESSLLAISDSVALVCLPDIDGLETEDLQWHRHFAQRASSMLEHVCAGASPDDEELISHFSRITNQARHLVRNETASKHDLEYVMSSGAMEFAGSLLRLVNIESRSSDKTASKNAGQLKTARRIDGRRQWTSQRPLHRRHRAPRRLRLIGWIG